MDGIKLDKYGGKDVNKDVNKVSDRLKWPVSNAVAKRVHDNLKNAKLRI